MEEYKVGPGNPPLHTRFGAGNKANPQGKTSAHRKAEIRAAELAALVQLEWMESLHNVVTDAQGDVKKLEYINKEMNTLIKNAQDRGFGAPKQPTELTSPDGSMSPAAATSDAVLAAIKAKHESST